MCRIKLLNEAFLVKIANSNVMSNVDPVGLRILGLRSI